MIPDGARYWLQRRPRGLFLLKVFFTVAVVFAILAAILSMLTVHPRLVMHDRNRHHAKLAAESLLDETITRLLKDKDYHQDGQLKNEGAEETATLTFDKANPNYSSNNSRGATAVEGSNGPVFPNMAHLVAVGECRGTRYVAEAVVVFQRFPYALASTGKIVSEGKLEVFGVDTFADTNGGISEEEKKPGHIVSNLTEPDAVTLNPEALIEGDVRSSGGVLQNGATIKGAVKTAQSAADLPSLNISDYDPLNFNDTYTVEAAPGDVMGQPEPLDISNTRLRVNANGNRVEINNGINLDDGMMYVEGDLIVRGGVRGKGAIVATGKVEIYGQSSIDGEMTALLSGGGVKIDGQGLGISSFRGMVATLGNFEADSTNVYGAYLALGKDPVTQLGSSTMTLRDVQSVHAPDVTKIDIVGHVKLQKMFEGGYGNEDSNGNQIGLRANGKFYPFTVSKNPGETQAAYEERRDPIIAASYEALKGPTDGSPHPMANGAVIVIDSNGNEIIVPDKMFSAYGKAIRDWTAYLESVAKKEVEIVPIFSIDLNRFTSGYNRVKILTYGERVSEK